MNTTVYTTTEASKPPHERDWLAIHGTVGLYLLTAVAIAAALMWNEDRKIRLRQLEIAEKNQHVLELYTGVLQKDIDEIRSERAGRSPRMPDTLDAPRSAE